MSPPAPPFSCTYSPQVPELLYQLKCTIAVSTFQAGKVIFISAKDESSLIQLPRTFDRPMGMTQRGLNLALATKDEVIVFKNEISLAKNYPKHPDTYDALYMPRKKYFTGPLDLHDISWCGNDFVAVNTAFSCIIKIDDQFSFTPVWNPSFISDIKPEDRCHLNGLVVQNDKLKFATAFNSGNTNQSWKENILSSGVLMDIPSNTIIASGLGMPHSPRVYEKKLFLLLSATGEIVEVEASSGKTSVVNKLKGFVRGMAYHNGYVFVGLSKLRKNSSTFSKLPVAEFADRAGIVILHLATGAIVGEIIYQNSVDEIYDCHVLAEMIRPNIVNTDKPEHKQGITTPQSSWWALEKGETNISN